MTSSVSRKRSTPEPTACDLHAHSTPSHPTCQRLAMRTFTLVFYIRPPNITGSRTLAGETDGRLTILKIAISHD